MSNIATRLGSLAVPIDSVTPYPGNPRRGDIGAISSSIAEFGQNKPIVVQQSTGHIIAGNHLWRAAKALEWADIAVVFVEMDDTTAKRFLIADNRTQEVGDYDEDALAAILVELDRGGLLPGTGYDSDDIEALLRRIEAVDAGAGGSGGRGRAKLNVCAFCQADNATRFQLKLQWLADGEDKSRGAGSLALCETDWLAYAQPHMNRPVDSIEALKGEGDEDEGTIGG